MEEEHTDGDGADGGRAVDAATGVPEAGPGGGVVGHRDKAHPRVLGALGVVRGGEHEVPARPPGAPVAEPLGRPIGFAGLAADSAAQLALPFDRAAESGLDTALDRVRDRFGARSVTRGTLLRAAPHLAVPQLPEDV